MTTVRTHLNEAPAARTPFGPTSDVPRSDVQAAIEHVRQRIDVLIAEHAGLPDAHPSYLTQAEADAAYLTQAEADALYEDAGAAAATVAAHVALSDPHSQYHNNTRGDARYPVVVASRAAIKALDTTNVSAAYLTEAGREGLFFWRAGNFSAEVATDTAEGVFIKATAIAAAAGAWVRDDYLDGVRATWFGAIADGSTNNYTALAGALAVAQQQQVPLRLTGDTAAYRYGTTLTMTTLVPIIGDGIEQSVLEYTGAAEALKIIPPLFSASYTAFPGHVLRDFTVRHSSAGSGTYGIHLSITGNGYPYAQFLWENLEVGVFGTRSILINNAISATDGVFVGKFVNVMANGGWQNVNIGDSVTFDMCRVYGTSATQNFSTTMIAGARELVILNCSLVTTGGVYFGSCNGIRMLYNHIEIGTGQNFTGANANVEFNNCTQVSVRGGRISKLGTGTRPTYTILCGGTTAHVLIDEVDLVKGSSSHVYAPATTSDIVVDGSTCTFDVAKAVTLQGATSFTRYAYSRQIFSANANGQVTVGATVYCAHETNAVESVVNFPIPIAGTISQLSVATAGAPGAAQTYTFHVSKNYATTAVTCVISGAASNTASDTTHSVAVAAGDVISIKVVASGGAASSGNIKWSFQLTF